MKSATIRHLYALLLGMVGGMAAPSLILADGDLPTKFSNTGSIINTRHNLTQDTIPSQGANMDPYRNDYGEVCVYCHTPHGANTQIDAPLWNRTFNSQTYTTYDTLGTSTLTATVNQPGISSLTCLSCHDGTVGMDSIINMPGSGKYSASQETAQSNAWLNAQWTNAAGPDASTHLALKSGECLACHSKDAGVVGAGATDFTAATIGTNLTNDHPVGINLPTTRIGVDFADPTVQAAKLAFYDLDSDNRADANEIRFYKTGSDYRVECASCHDPHGVPTTPADNSPLIPTFLRIANTNSAVCLTCHDK